MTQYYVNGAAQYPWQSIVFIEALFPDGNTAVGSGVMVGPNDVLTAAHVVHSGALGGSAVQVSVTPAYDPDVAGGPFGTVAVNGWHAFTNFDPDGDGFIIGGNEGPGLAGTEKDVALLDLAQPLGESTGWMGLDPYFDGGQVNMTGYPGFYGNELMNEIGYVQDDSLDWFMDIGDLEVHPGNSGGPLWYATEHGASVVGIVSTTGAACDIGGTYAMLTDWMYGNDDLIAVA